MPSSFNWPRFFVVAGLALGLLAVFSVPPFREPDAATQMTRLVLIDRGYLIPPAQSAHPSGYRIDGCMHTYMLERYFRLTSPTRPHWGSQFDRFRCGRDTSPRDLGPRWGANTEVNPPVAYLPPWIGYRIGRALGGAAWAFYGARLAQLFAFVALVWFALRLLPWGRPYLAAVALLPAVIQLAGSVSADPFTNALAFVIVAATLHFIDRARRGGRRASTLELCGYGAALVAFALTKTAVIPILGVAALIPSAAFGSLRRRIAVIGPLLVVSLGLAAAWAFGVVSRITVSIFPHANSKLGAQWIRAHPWDFALSVLRAWSDPTEVRHVASEIVTVVTQDKLVAAPPVLLVVGVVAVPFVIRLANPSPGWIRAIGARLHRTGRHEPTGIVTSPDPAAESAPAPARFSPTRTARMCHLEIVVTIAILAVGFALIEVGSAISAVPPGAREAKWVQARYFVPYLPLLLFGVPRPRPTTRRYNFWTGIVPIAVLLGANLWLVAVNLHRFWTW